MDPENIGKEKFGVVVLDGGKVAEEVLRWCDLALVTGTTVVNGTLEPILEVAGAKAVFYGISIAGVARLLGLTRFCPRSTWLPGCWGLRGSVQGRREGAYFC
jgi:hypothetical protein